MVAQSVYKPTDPAHAIWEVLNLKQCPARPHVLNSIERWSADDTPVVWYSDGPVTKAWNKQYWWRRLEYHGDHWMIEWNETTSDPPTWQWYRVTPEEVEAREGGTPVELVEQVKRAS